MGATCVGLDEKGAVRRGVVISPWHRRHFGRRTEARDNVTRLLTHVDLFFFSVLFNATSFHLSRPQVATQVYIGFKIYTLRQVDVPVS